MLNSTVLELTIEVPTKFSYKPGQRALLGYKDEQGEFKRAYSVVEYKQTKQGCQIVLCIKLLENSRGGAILKTLQVGSMIEVSGIFGHFVLQETANPKVFIGTGTGLVPLISMATETKSDKRLYFSVSHKSDLFYQDRIQNIAGLKSSIHVSREQVEGCEPGRIDLSTESFPPETEFYICGNPVVVPAFAETLKSRGYQNIYTEQY